MDQALQQLEPLLAALRPYLTPITTQLPAPLHDFGLSQLGPECYSTIVEKLDPATSPECLQLALSKAIGVGIVTMSTVIKVPQLLKLIRSGSAQGISFLSYLLETTAYLITVAYNLRQGNPFSTFGEIGLLAVQNVVISALVLEFQGKRAAAATFIAALGAAGYALFNPQVIDMEMLQYAQAATIPLGLASKLPQIISIARQKSTGQLSAFAVSSSCH
jgi:mannose-P-dolichol utilization defect protein 1